MTEEPARYYLRFAQAGDQNELVKFYASHAHKNVLKREPELLKKMIGDGAVVLIEEAGGKTVAALILHPYGTTDAHGNEDVKWREIGTLRCTLNGYGLADALISVGVLRTFLLDPPSDRFIAQMATVPVQDISRNLGFREFTPLQEFFNIEAALLPEWHDRENWYQVGIEGMPVAARAFVKLFDNPMIENPKTHQKIVLDFSRSNFCQMLMPEIRALAAANLGDVDKPDLALSVKKQQKKLLRDFFH